MIGALLLTSFPGVCGPLQDLRVEGLHDGEALTELPPAIEEPATEERLWGRVVDAHSGLPVPGASIETWTEEFSRPGDGFRRVGEARSRADGGFRVRMREGAVEAEKVRVRADGYLTFPGTIADLELVRLMPRPPWTSRVQVLDLADRPIPNARITTTYSCSHDVPAFELLTGPDGVAELAEYGLQRQTPELRLHAPGFGAIEYVHHTEVPADPVGGEPAVLRLARRRAFGARVLDAGGRPLAATFLRVIDGEGQHVPATGERGEFFVASSYDGHEPTIQVQREGRVELVHSGLLPRDRQVALRVDSDDWPEETPTGRLVLRTEGAPEGEPEVPVHLFHPAGWALPTWMRDDTARDLEFPAGEVLLVVGETFSGWEEEAREVELAPDGRLELVLAPRAEPRVEVLTPPGDPYRLVVQAGADSIEREPEREGRTPIPVPAGEPIVVLSEGARTRRLVLPPLTADGVADLRDEACVLPPTRAQLADAAPRGVVRVHALAPDGSPLAVGGSVYGAGDPQLVQEAADVLRVEAPVGYPFALGVGAEGFAACWVSAFAGEQETELVVEPAPLARLAIFDPQDLGIELVGPEADQLDALHPGPLSLELRLADGRRAGLSLVLAPGEVRELRITSE